MPRDNAMAFAGTWITQARDRLFKDAAVAAPIQIYVGALCLLISLAMFGWFGIRHGVDSARYFDGAANLLAGRPLEGKQASYFGYVAIVGLSKSVGADTRLLVLLQIIVASVAAVALYDLGCQLSGRVAGVLAAACFAINVDIARWHLFVLTDSLYISLVILSTWLVHRAAERAGWWYAGAALTLFCTALIRPNGWILLPLATVYWMARASISPRLKAAAAGLVVLVFLAATVLVSAFRQGIQAETPDVWLRQGTVVWSSDDWRVAMPHEPANSLGNGWTGALGYGARHPWASSRLALTRMGAELIHARPSYSATRNVLAALSVLLFYPFAVLGGWRLKTVPLARLMIAVIGSHLLIVALTFADWDGRFLLYFLPLVYVFAACEFAERLRRSRRPAVK